jgi:CubicO group peptidase (beta-lactamase class C family)
MQKRRFSIFSLVVLLAAIGTARADQVDDYVKAAMLKQHIPGVSIAVVKDGKIIKAEGYGLANVELNVPARGDTVFKIGSVSKQFIAAGILLLAQEGKLSLDDPVSKFLDGTPETWNPITIRHLLTHTSGIVREAPGFDPLKIQNDADVIKTAYSEKLRFTPGEKWEYCNLGYFSLAEIIRKVSGKPWPDYLNDAIFKPLEMNATRTTDMTALVSNRANGYGWRDGNYQNAAIYFALRPSGAFLSTVLDLAKWDAALYTDRLLKQSTRAAMWAEAKLNNGKTHPYGYGWSLETVGGHKMIHHGGSLPGFRAQLARFLDDKVTVIVLTNSNSADPETMAIDVAEFFIPNLIPTPTAVKVDPQTLDAYVGEYQQSVQGAATGRVTREGDKLMIQVGPTGEKREMFATNDSRFFTAASRRLFYLFAKDEKGQVTDLVVQVEGREIGRAKKIK